MTRKEHKENVKRKKKGTKPFKSSGLLGHFGKGASYYLGTQFMKHLIDALKDWF